MLDKEIEKIKKQYIKQKSKEKYDKCYDLVFSEEKIFNRFKIILKSNIPSASNILLAILFDNSLILADDLKIEVISSLLLQRWQKENNTSENTISQNQLIDTLNEVRVELKKLSSI
ncbi:MAG: hypothetical protein M9916_13805 [Crocinitomicaceae bacterium]|nr:hypothetical protein [Crocinitomicaceae bacterium]